MLEKNAPMKQHNINIISMQRKYMHDVIELMQYISEFKINEDEYNSIWISYKNQINVHSIVALIDRKIVGYGTVIIETKIRGGKFGHIEDIVSHNDFRKIGVGKAILDSLLEIAEDKGCYKVALACKEHNIAFYEKCSYKLNGCSMSINLNMST